jgi:hypothetical protein
MDLQLDEAWIRIYCFVSTPVPLLLANRHLFTLLQHVRIHGIFTERRTSWMLARMVEAWEGARSLTLCCNYASLRLHEVAAVVSRFRALRSCTIWGFDSHPLAHSVISSVGRGSWLQLHHLSLDVSDPAINAMHIAALSSGGGSRLRHLVLRMQRRPISQSMGMAIGGLRHLPELQYLCLQLVAARATIGAIPAAMEARHAPCLRRLVLDLCGAHIPPGDIDYIALLSRGQFRGRRTCLLPTSDCAHRLRELTVTTWGMGRGDGMGYIMGTVLRCELPMMRALSMDIGGNRMTDDGVRLLLPVWTVPPPCLRVVRLGLQGSEITAAGALSLLWLCCLPSLEVLRLLLGHCQLKDEGVAALSALAGCKQLRELELDLCGNEIGDAGVDSLVAWFDASVSVRSVCLHLKGNAVTDRGAQVLMQCRSRLDRMVLDLRQNSMTTGGPTACLLWP